MLKTKRALLALVEFTAGSAGIEVGIFKDGRGGRKHPNSKKTVAELGYLHENGFMNVQAGKFVNPRPFVSPINDDRDLFKKATRSLKRALKEATAAQSAIPLVKALDRIAFVYASAIRARLRTDSTKPALDRLSVATIKRKGSSIPLIDTGKLAKSVQHRITGTRKLKG